MVEINLMIELDQANNSTHISPKHSTSLGRAKLVFSLVFLFLILGSSVLADGDSTISAEELYKKKQYETAIAKFQELLKASPNSAQLHSNLACSLYQLGRSEEALQHWQTALKNSKDPAQSGRINYNIGNYYFKANQLDKAINAYKDALRFNPDDTLAKYNLEIALKKQQPPPPNNNGSQPNNNNNEDNNNPPPPNNNNNEPKPNKTPKMSKDEAERLLDSMQQNERNPAPLRNKEQNSSSSTMVGHDW